MEENKNFNELFSHALSNLSKMIKIAESMNEQEIIIFSKLMTELYSIVLANIHDEHLQNDIKALCALIEEAKQAKTLQELPG